jgi:maltoporin
MRNAYLRKKFNILAASVPVAVALCAATAQAQELQPLEFHGYLRTGTGSTSEGGKQACFGLNGAPAKYRLGNECETYGEIAFGLPFGKPDGGGPWAKYNIMLATIENNSASDFENSKGSSFDIASRQNYFEAGGFFSSDALRKSKIWVGKRYYNRHDVHINDYYYWNNSGLGAGIEDMEFGSVKYAFAYHSKGDGILNGSLTTPGDLVNGLNTRRFSVRAYDIGVNTGGKLETEIVLLKGDSVSGTNEGSGTILFAEHTQSGIFGNGFNKVAVAIGSDAGAGGANLPTFADATENAKGSDFRIIEQAFFAPKGSNWSGLATAVLQDVKPDLGEKQTWLSLGVRPQYQFTDTFSLAVEVGHDQVKTGDLKGSLTKFTIAPQLALARGFWARPVFRAFATFARWNEGAGTVANGVFGDKRSGLSYGAQVEAWW